MGSKDKNLKEFLLNFYSRRVKRLLPALVFCLLVSSFLTCIFNENPYQILKTSVAAVFGLSNIYLYFAETDYFAVSAQLNTFTHTWSLGIEEQFYLIFPLILFFIVKGSKNKSIISILTIFSLASILLQIYFTNENNCISFYMMPCRFWELAIGFYSYYIVVPKFTILNSIKRTHIQYILIILIVYLMFFGSEKFNQYIIVLSTALLLHVMRDKCEGRIDYILGSSPFVLVGKLSYSLYLWHWPLLCLLRFTIGLNEFTSYILYIFALISFSVFSYTCIEKRFRYKFCPDRYHPGLYLAAKLVVITCCVLFLFRFNAKYLYSDNPAKDVRSYASVDHVDHDNKYQLNFNKNNKIIFMGDSYTDHISPIIDLLQEDFKLTTYRSDTIIFPTIVESHNEGVSKHMSNDRALHANTYFNKHFSDFGIGDYIVLSSRLEYAFNNEFLQGKLVNRKRIKHDDQLQPVTIEVSFQQWLTKLDELCIKANDVGTKVIVFLPIPVFEAKNGVYPPYLCNKTWFRPKLSSCCPINFKTNRFTFESRNAFIFKELKLLSDKNNNLFLFDPYKILFNKNSNELRSNYEGKSLYRDDNHLSPYGSLLLYQPFLNFLSSTQE